MTTRPHRRARRRNRPTVVPTTMMGLAAAAPSPVKDETSCTEHEAATGAGDGADGADGPAAALGAQQQEASFERVTPAESRAAACEELVALVEQRIGAPIESLRAPAEVLAALEDRPRPGAARALASVVPPTLSALASVLAGTAAYAVAVPPVGRCAVRWVAAGAARVAAKRVGDMMGAMLTTTIRRGA